MGVTIYIKIGNCLDNIKYELGYNLNDSDGKTQIKTILFDALEKACQEAITIIRLNQYDSYKVYLHLKAFKNNKECLGIFKFYKIIFI